MSGKIINGTQTDLTTAEIYDLADGINNALFAIFGNAELIRLKVTGGDSIDDHISSILLLTQKIAYFTNCLSTSAKPERSKN